MTKPILDVLSGKRPEHVPVWLMRQAGRYLPEYRELRSKSGSFLDLCLTPSLATEITLQPIRRFDFDAAILFADILLVPYSLGQKLEFLEGEGPQLRDLAIAQLSYNEEMISAVFQTLRNVRQQLPDKTALIGFCGSPWTVAAYMIDGNSRKDFALAKSWVEEKPELLKDLISILIDASENYLCRQIEAGAEILQLFESWAGLLSGEEFRRWIIQPTHELVSRVKKKHPHIPIIGFPRAAGIHYADYADETGIDALSIDQNVSLDMAASLQKKKILQGNLDPDLLLEGGEDMLKAAAAIIERLGPKHIFNLGHGVLQKTPPENVQALVKFIHSVKIGA